MANIEGRNPIIEALRSDRPIDKLMISNTSKEGSIKKIIGMAKEKNIVIQYVDKHKLDEISTSHSHQGVIAVVSDYKYYELEDLFEIARERGEDPFFIILDEITDPHNLGTIIRTADAAGVDAIIALKGCVDIYNPKVIRSTMGSIFDMNVIHTTQEEALRILKLKKFDIVSSYLDTNNYYNTVEYNYKTALVIGNEANGINEELVSKSDVLVKIPIYGKAESLNAAISSAILMYEIKKYLV